MSKFYKQLGLLGIGLVCLATLFFLHPKKEDSSDFSKATAKEVGGYGGQTTGGSQATEKEQFIVTTRQEFLKALGKPTNAIPKIIRIKGTIDMSKNDQGIQQNEWNYTQGTDYSLNAYLNMYHPSTNTKKKPSGKQEEERKKAQQNQAKQISIRLPENTTILGEKGSKIINGTIIIQKNNVILRNITVEAPMDYFPQWDPTDGENGNWNSQYDAVSIEGAKNIWIDHSTFTDGIQGQKDKRTYYGREYQQYDGLTDITNGADNVTLSNNIYQNHDKTILIGNSDNKTSDRNKLHVTLIGNRFEQTIQRTPRVRFGHVQLINNLYKVTGEDYQYSWGIGKESQFVAENNVFELKNVHETKIAKEFGGNLLKDTGTLINGKEQSIATLLKSKQPSEMSPKTKSIFPSSKVEKEDERNAGANLTIQ